MEKNDDTIVIHLPRTKRLQFERLGERKGLNKSEYGRMVLEHEIDKHESEFEFMKSIFELHN